MGDHPLYVLLCYLVEKRDLGCIYKVVIGYSAPDLLSSL